MLKIREWLAVPFGMVIAAFYALTGNYIVSLLCLTIIVKLALLPSQLSMQKNQAKQLRLQPKVSRIREKYASNQQKMNQEIQELYSKEGYGAGAAGCLPMLIQLPIMMGVYWAVNYTPLSNVLRIPSTVVTGLKTAVEPFVTSSSGYAAMQGEINVLKHFDKIIANISATPVAGLTQEYINKIQTFADKFYIFGLDMTVTPKFDLKNLSDCIDKYWIIPVLLFVVSMVQSVYMFIRQKKTNPEMAKNPSMGCMTFMTPAMMIWFSFVLPINVGVYMILSNILALIQMFVLNYTHSPNKVLSKVMVDETIYRRSKEANMRKAHELKN